MENKSAFGRLISLVLIATMIGCTWFLLTRNHQTDQVHQDFWLVYHDEASGHVTTASLLRLLEVDNQQWDGANLTGIDLANQNLDAANIQRATMNEATLTGASLKQAIFTGTTLEASELSDIDFSFSRLNETSFLKSTLVAARFESANLQQAALEQVYAPQCQFQNADLTESYCLMADFTRSDFENADFTFAHLEAALFVECNLTGTRFDGAVLLDSDFSSSNWWRATGINVDLLEDFKQQYPPTTAELKADFFQWIQETESAEPIDTPR